MTTAPDRVSARQHAASLDPVTFEARTLARDEYACITSASTALAPLYSGAVPREHAISSSTLRPLLDAWPARPA